MDGKILIIEYLQLLAIWLSLIIACISVHSYRSTSRCQKTLDVMHSYNNDDRVAKAYIVIRNYRNQSTPPPDYIGRGKPNSSERRDNFLFLMNMFEIIAIGLQQKVYDEAMIVLHFGSELQNTFDEAKELIDYIRTENKEDESDFLQQFENWLVSIRSDKYVSQINHNPG